MNLNIAPGTLGWLVLGSNSDREIVKNAKLTKIFDECGVLVHTSVLSAHRNLDDLTADCKEAVDAGIKVVIAMAGMAAVLPGIMDPLTGGTMPILGVPLPSTDYPDAADAAITMLRNPPGTGVMVSGICESGIKNTALNACKILATFMPEVKEKLQAYRAKLAESKPARHNVPWEELS